MIFEISLFRKPKWCVVSENAVSVTEQSGSLAAFLESLLGNEEAGTLTPSVAHLLNRKSVVGYSYQTSHFSQCCYWVI